MRPSRTPWEQVKLRFAKNRLAVYCLWTLVIMIGLSVLVPLLSPHDIYAPQVEQRFQSPTAGHPFGTSATGVDMFTKSFAGLRLTLIIGLTASFLTLMIGLVYGSISGYAGGMVDNGMMRVVDVLYGLPRLAYIILVVFVFREYGHKFLSRENQYMWEIMLMILALGTISWLTIARIVRGQVLSIKELEFIEAARAIGASDKRIIFSHIMPNILGPIIVYTTLTAPTVMLFESFISFLGLGIKSPSIGRIISDDAISRIAATNLNWWLLVFPGLLLAVVLFCLNVIGDGLRDAFDVR